MKIRATDAAKFVALAVVYAGAARLGLAVDAVSGFAALVWPPSGMALAAILWLGFGMWPGVFIGAAAVNMVVGAPLPVALGIAVGNTLEAVLGAYALRRVANFDHGLARVRDVIALLVLGASLSTMLSASIGVLSLNIGGLIEPGRLFETWRAWWIGDLMGILVFAPMLLLWTRGAHAMPRGWRLVEAVGLGVALAAFGFLTFFVTFPDSGRFEPYMLFPPLMWAAVRFGPRGAATATFVATCIAIWGTATGRGPFVRPELHERLLALQIFTGLTTATFLVLAAAIAERRAAELSAEVARMEAERANHAKAEFLAVMSHELRTPLNAISGFVDLLLIGAQGSLNDKQIDSLHRIQRNQMHLLTLINDLLSFARKEAGRLVLEPVRLRVMDVIDDIEPLIQPELRRKELCFDRFPVDAELHVWADPARLRQILINLLSNAVKYTDAKGTIAIGADRADGAAHIWVRDTGIGVPPDQVGKVFEPFYQVERGMTRRYPGVGLGLTIARDLARAMDGDVTIESVPGEGTKATVILPAL